jgi:hypothetical protein
MSCAGKRCIMYVYLVRLLLCVFICLYFILFFLIYVYIYLYYLGCVSLGFRLDAD